MEHRVKKGKQIFTWLITAVVSWFPKKSTLLTTVILSTFQSVLTFIIRVTITFVLATFVQSRATRIASFTYCIKSCCNYRFSKFYECSNFNSNNHKIYSCSVYD